MVSNAGRMRDRQMADGPEETGIRCEGSTGLGCRLLSDAAASVRYVRRIVCESATGCSPAVLGAGMESSGKLREWSAGVVAKMDGRGRRQISRT